MSGKIHLHLFLSLLLALGLLALGSCSDDPADPDDGNGGGGIDALVAAAKDSLSEALWDQFNEDATEPDRPSDVDFTVPYNAFLAAYNTDSSNLDARFGLAVTGLMMLGVDQEINDAFDEWESYLENNTPFEVESSRLRPLGVPLFFGPGRDAFDLPLDLVLHSALGEVNIARQSDPDISRIQNILGDIVGPRLRQTIDHLGPVIADPDYVFDLTARMQGDLEADPLEIDQTDLLALRAGCRLLAAGCNIAAAYDMSLSAYTAQGMLDAFDQETGNFLRLREGRAAGMQAVNTDFTGAIDDMDAAIDALFAERISDPNQDDDLIRIGPGDLDEADLLDLQNNYLADIRSAFTDGGVTRTEDWDDDAGTPDTPLLIDLHSFFDDPLTDFKALLPPYEVTTETRPMDSSWFYDEVDTNVTVVLVSGGYHSASYYISYRDFEYEYNQNFGDETILAAMDVVAMGLVSQVTSMAEWSGRLSVSMYWQGTTPSGEQTLPVIAGVNYSLADYFVAVPVFTWTADTYEEWIAAFPDATVNGLLPEFSTATELVDYFGWDPTGWEKVVTVDWTDDEPDYIWIGPR